MADKQIIAVHFIERRGTRSLGPGLRYVVWTQGCPFNCPGCVTPESRDVDGGSIAEVESIVDDIAANTHINGLTISGGEPFLQAESLAALLDGVARRRPDLDVIVFTGFKLENLNSADARKALSHIDLLIDSPYVDSLNDGKGLRGSSNQRFHYLTDRLKAFSDELENGKRRVEITFRNDETDILGIPLNSQPSKS